MGSPLRASSSDGLRTVSSRNVRIYAIKSQKRRLLDVARETYKENLNDVFEMGEELARKFGLEISMAHTQQGFVFSCPLAELDEKPLPKMFIHPVRPPLISQLVGGREADDKVLVGRSRRAER